MSWTYKDSCLLVADLRKKKRTLARIRATLQDGKYPMSRGKFRWSDQSILRAEVVGKALAKLSRGKTQTAKPAPAPKPAPEKAHRCLFTEAQWSAMPPDMQRMVVSEMLDRLLAQ